MDVRSFILGVYGNGPERSMIAYAAEPVSPEEACSIMQEALAQNGGAYNGFKPEILLTLKDTKIHLGREFSPVVYIKPEYISNFVPSSLKALKRKLRASECSQLPNGTIRIWWD